VSRNKNKREEKKRKKIYATNFLLRLGMTPVPLHLSFSSISLWKSPTSRNNNNNNQIECIILICGRRRTAHHLYRSGATSE
jgi:hypothetical protein